MVEKGYIPPVYQAFYIQSMLFNSQSAINSMQKIDDIFEVLLNDPAFDYSKVNEIVDVNYVLDHMQNIIVQAAALSRYFWPPAQGSKNAKEIYTHRGIYLREQFNIIDENILKDRKL